MIHAKTHFALQMMSVPMVTIASERVRVAADIANVPAMTSVFRTSNAISRFKNAAPSIPAAISEIREIVGCRGTFHNK